METSVPFTQNRNSSTCTPMFTEHYSRQKQTKRPSPDEWVKKMWYIHTMILL